MVALTYGNAFDLFIRTSSRIFNSYRVDDILLDKAHNYVKD